jgi:hypothetical protein
MSNLQMLALGKVYSAATYDQLYLDHWVGVSQTADFKQQWELQRDHIARLPDKRTLLFSYVPITKFKAPDAESRAVMNERMKDIGHNLIASAIVMPQKGFGAATVRSIVAGLTMLARQEVPTQVFSDLAASYEWLGRYGMSSATIASAASEFIRRVEAAGTKT